MARSDTYGLEIFSEAPSSLFEKRSNTDIRSQIWSTINKMPVINRPGYHATSAIFPNPGLYVEEHGFIGIPLSSNNAGVIISKAEQPHRKIWELDATQITFKNPEWEKAIRTMFLAANQEMDMVTDVDNVSVDLHKLMLCESGSHYKKLKPTKKEIEENEPSGIFGTLMVFLPSPHKGGGFELENSKKSHRFETDDRCEFDTTFAAWYSDLDEKMLPVISGCQLILKYNLAIRSRPDSKPLPSTTGVRANLQLLSQLLQDYNTQLKKGDSKLQPYLLHQMVYEYKDYEGPPSLKYMFGHDELHVEYFSELAKELGYEVYLAKSELSISKLAVEDHRLYRDEYGHNGDSESSEGAGETEKTLTLTCLREPEGRIVAEELVLDDDMFINPHSRDKDGPDREEDVDPDDDGTVQHVKYYDDMVVLLIPPCRRMDFLLLIDRSQYEVLSRIRKLRKEVAKDGLKKPHLERLCILLLRGPHVWTSHRDPISINGTPIKAHLLGDFLEQISSAVLEIERFDLFDKLGTSTSGRIILSNASIIGRCAASLGITAMKDILVKGIRTASSVQTKLEFVQKFQDGFNGHGAASDNDGTSYAAKVTSATHQDTNGISLQLQEIMLEAVINPEVFHSEESRCLAENSDHFSRDLFEKKVKPALLKSTTSNKLAFLQGIQSVWRMDTKNNWEQFKADLLDSIWNSFAFDQSTDSTATNHILDIEDLKESIYLTLKFAPHVSVIEHIMPRFARAAPTATAETASNIFVPLIRVLVENKDPLICMLEPLDEITPAHRFLVLELLKRYIETNVGPEPREPSNWRLKKVSECRYPTGFQCEDCQMVNDFLDSTKRQTLEISAVEHRRKHLDKHFKRAKNTSFDVETIKNGLPYTWRITKHRREHEVDHKNWQTRLAKATSTIQGLATCPQEKHRLRELVDCCPKVLNDARLENIGDFRWEQPLAEIDLNARSNPRTPPSAKKRARDPVDVEGDGPYKRTRSAVNDNENEICVGEEDGENVKIVDLTGS